MVDNRGTGAIIAADRVPERLAVRVVLGGVVQRQIGMVLPYPGHRGRGSGRGEKRVSS